MARWGNALGGWRKQKRNALGQFSGSGGRKLSRQIYKSQKKANSRAHRARTKGSVKARGKEFVTTGPRRTRQMAGGAALYVVGRNTGSVRASSYGLALAQRGAKSSVGRTQATYAMSKGLKKSRNRAAKDAHLHRIGTSRRKRNLQKLAVGAVVVGAAAYAQKKGHGVYGERDFDYAFVSVGRNVRKGAPGFASAQVSRGWSGEMSKVTARAGSRKKSKDFVGDKRYRKVKSVYDKARKNGIV